MSCVFYIGIEWFLNLDKLGIYVTFKMLIFLYCMKDLLIQKAITILMYYHTIPAAKFIFLYIDIYSDI